MRWERGRKRSKNLEDRRHERTSRGGGLNFPFPFPMGRGRQGGGRVSAGRRPKFSLGTLLLLAVMFFLFRGSLFGGGGGGTGLPLPVPQGGTGIEVPFPKLPGGTPGFPGAPGPVSAGSPADAAEEETVKFLSYFLDDIQEIWHRLLPDYRDAKLVIFRDHAQSDCGYAAAQMGPFYCPADEKVYVDLSFYGDLRDRFGAPGDFAQIYVLAHEIGHHVQKVTGVEPQVRRAQQANPSRKNELSVRMELMADCLAGVWAASTDRDHLEPGDLREGLNAAAAIGDDRLQKMQRGRVQPESFTHGSSEQRVEWLQRGIESGQPGACDTF